MKEDSLEQRKPASKQEIQKIKQQSRDELAGTIRESRRNRDEELKKLEEAKKRFFKFLSLQKDKPKTIIQEIKNKEGATRRLLKEGKYEIDLQEKLLLKEREQVLYSTIIEPLSKIKNLILDYENRDEVKSISKNFSEENFRIFMSEKDPNEVGAIIIKIFDLLKTSKYSDAFYQKIINLSEDYFEEIEAFLPNNFHSFYNAEFINNLVGAQSFTEGNLPDEKIVEAIKSFEPYYKEQVSWQHRYSKLSSLTNFILIKGPDSLKEWMKEQIKSEIEKENFSIIPIFNNFDVGSSLELEKVFEENIFQYTQKRFSISKEDFFSAGHSNTEIYWSENLKTMCNIERKITGGVKRLLKDYGIHEFNRHPQKILINQLKEESVDRPYGVVIYPHSDHNNNFDKKDTVFKNFYEKDKKNRLLKVFEVGSNHDLLKYLIKLKRKYKHKISYLILGGHGSTEGVEFADMFMSYKAGTSQGELTKDVLDKREKTLKMISEFFTPDATIVLVSCSTGAEGGFGSKLRDKINLRVLAPKEDSNLKKLEFKDGKLEVEYNVEKNVFNKIEV